MEEQPRVIDADGHTLEPPDALSRFLDPKYRDRLDQGPEGVRARRQIDGLDVMEHPPGTLEALRFTPESIRERFGDIAADGFDAQAVVRALDVEGIDVSVIYGPLYEFWVEGMDPELAAALARAYSRWLVEYSEESGERIIGAAPIPLHDVGLAVELLHYVVDDLDMRAVWTRPNPVHGRMLGHADFEPFFDAVDDLGVPLSFHEGSGSKMENIGSTRFASTWFEQHACVHPMEQQLVLASLIVQGVLERHPNLKVAFMESGAAWAPAWLHRLDEHQELVGWHDAPTLTLKPSEYFQRQCFISSEPDEHLLYQVVDVLGDSNVIFATDFPHPDSKYPNAVSDFLDLPRVPVETKRKMMWDNPLRFYGFDESTLPRARQPSTVAVDGS